MSPPRLVRGYKCERGHHMEAPPRPLRATACVVPDESGHPCGAPIVAAILPADSCYRYRPKR